jgi:hypothetical protein
MEVSDVRVLLSTAFDKAIPSRATEIDTGSAVSQGYTDGPRKFLFPVSIIWIGAFMPLDVLGRQLSLQMPSFAVVDATLVEPRTGDINRVRLLVTIYEKETATPTPKAKAAADMIVQEDETKKPTATHQQPQPPSASTTATPTKTVAGTHVRISEVEVVEKGAVDKAVRLVLACTTILAILIWLFGSRTISAPG